MAGQGFESGDAVFHELSCQREKSPISVLGVVVESLKDREGLFLVDLLFSYMAVHGRREFNAGQFAGPNTFSGFRKCPHVFGPDFPQIAFDDIRAVEVNQRLRSSLM